MKVDAVIVKRQKFSTRFKNGDMDLMFSTRFFPASGGLAKAESR